MQPPDDPVRDRALSTAIFVQHFFGDILLGAENHDGVAFQIAAISSAHFVAVRFGVILSGEFSLSWQDGFFLVVTFRILPSYLSALYVFVFSVSTGFPNHPFFYWPGALSYSIYLFHGIAGPIVFIAPTQGNVGRSAH